ncbi:homeobox-leucine zipper protein REVOLUTA-like [Cornus florida]|uniref:homeobox-leucine zipper protein REVOLUTA-like n=1 Tax=Cornus florida TaxID=4283 RepID=UPI0028A11ECA|nr:homeobox-leucine zipper protein REVOLUTA-like [Cornus florida]
MAGNDVVMGSGGGSSSGSGRNGGGNQREDAGKYMRYTAEQIEVLEKAYAQCTKPSLSRRKQLIDEYPILANIDQNQIKVWFQNRRCRDKQKNEAIQLQLVNEKLIATNKFLMEENDRLQKQVSQLVLENENMRQQLQYVSVAIPNTRNEATVNSSQHSVMAVENPTGLLAVAEETMQEFLLKATGTAIEWVPIPGMKPGLDSVGLVAISHNCGGVAARASSLVSLEPTKIAEILKDRSSWFRDCRNQEVFARFSAGNGGTIELIYMQFYAPTTLVPACDFWTLRYTLTFEDGSLVVCEKSMSGSGAGPSQSLVSQFIRAKMLASGYLIRPCEGGGSIIHIVDHLDFEALSAPEVLRPLYESSKLVAQKITVAALHHIGQMAQEKNSGVTHALGKQPAVLRSFSQRLSRSFNGAVNGFSDDGWSLLNCDAAEDVILCVKSTKNLKTISNSSSALSLSGGILCVKASMLLQDVSPAILVRYLREHRSEWADFSVDAHSAASLKAGSVALPKLNSTQFSSSSIVLGHTVNDEEILEIIQLEGHALNQKDAFLFRNTYLLQLCNGIEEEAVGACSELIFAPIDEMLPDDALLLSSGFRILPLDSKTVDSLDSLTAQQTMDPASNFEVYAATRHIPGGSSSSKDSSVMLIIAFQFPFESHLQESVATMAQQYIHNIIATVQRVSKAITPCGLNPHVGVKLTPGSPEAVALANWICQSYSSSLGAELLTSNCQNDDSVFEQLWHYPKAILCCSFKSLPVCLFANQAGLSMLETTLMDLQDITLEKIFDESGLGALYSIVPILTEQGFASLPTGTCMSAMRRLVYYEQVIAWKVVDDGGALHSLAFAFLNWTFL